jgi:CRP/FNR family transcriptional regulator, cyclic AMP receptor protein
MDQVQRRRLLAQSLLFRDVSESDLHRLAEAAALRRYRRGQILFAEGDSGDSLLVVVEGYLKVFSSSAEGEEFVLAVLGPGEPLGELALADGGARSASAAALSDLAVLRLPRTELLAAGAASPQLMTALLVSVARLVRRLTGTAADLVFLDLPRRLAKLLLTERTEPGTDVIATQLSQEDIAHRLGVSRQSVNAALRDFSRRGWILQDNRSIRVLDPTALARFLGE